MRSRRLPISSRALRTRRGLAACALTAAAVAAVASGGAARAAAAAGSSASGSDTVATKPAGSIDLTGKPNGNAFDNALIATTASRYLGLWGGQACVDSHHDPSGQCKEFVNCVVALATGGHVWPVDPFGDYQAAFADAGGLPVNPKDATLGDIIQIGSRDDDPMLHTAIVLTNHHDGSFTVIDSNWVGQPVTPEMVGEHVWRPPVGALFWRLGTVSAKDGSAGGGSKGSDNGWDGTLLSTQPPAPVTLANAAPAGLLAGVTTITATVAPTPAANSATAKTPKTSNATTAPARPTAVRLYVDGKPYATAQVFDGAATLSLDTAALPDGLHHFTAESLSLLGAMTGSANGLDLTVANTHPAAALAVAPHPLVSGLTPLTVISVPAAPKALAWTVDGKPAAAAADPAGGYDLDTSTLTPGPHQVTTTVTDAQGRTAATAPVTLTVTGGPVGLRTAADVTGTQAAAGTEDLIGTDTAGRLLRYRRLGPDKFALGEPLVADRSFGAMRALISGHFTVANGPSQLLAVWADGTAHLYTFDAAGKLSAPTAIGGVDWSGYVGLTAGQFTGLGTSEIVGVTAAGKSDLISVTASTAGVRGLSAMPAGAPIGKSAVAEIDPADPADAGNGAEASDASGATGASTTGQTGTTGSAGTAGTASGTASGAAAPHSAGSATTVALTATTGAAPVTLAGGPATTPAGQPGTTPAQPGPGAPATSTPGAQSAAPGTTDATPGQPAAPLLPAVPAPVLTAKAVPITGLAAPAPGSTLLSAVFPDADTTYHVGAPADLIVVSPTGVATAQTLQGTVFLAPRPLATLPVSAAGAPVVPIFRQPVSTAAAASTAATLPDFLLTTATGTSVVQTVPAPAVTPERTDLPPAPNVVGKPGKTPTAATTPAAPALPAPVPAEFVPLPVPTAHGTPAGPSSMQIEF